MSLWGCRRVWEGRFVPSGPAAAASSAADEDFTSNFNESKTEAGSWGTPREKGNKCGWSIAAVQHIPSRSQPSGCFTPSPPRCRSCSSLDQPCRNPVTLQEGAQTPHPYPLPLSSCSKPVTSLCARCQKCLGGGNEGDLKTPQPLGPVPGGGGMSDGRRGGRSHGSCCRKRAGMGPSRGERLVRRCRWPQWDGGQDAWEAE